MAVRPRSSTYKKFSKDGNNFCCQDCMDLWGDTLHEAYRQKCFFCSNFKNEEPNSDRQGVWYNHVCSIASVIYPSGNRVYKQCRYTCDSIECKFYQRWEFNSPPLEAQEITRFELMEID